MRPADKAAASVVYFVNLYRPPAAPSGAEHTEAGELFTSLDDAKEEAAYSETMTPPDRRRVFFAVLASDGRQEKHSKSINSFILEAANAVCQLEAHGKEVPSTASEAIDWYDGWSNEGWSNTSKKEWGTTS